MLIAQISDPHILAESWVAYGEIDTNALFAKAIERVNTQSPRPDLVLISGDLTNDGMPEQYDALMARLDKLQLPYLPIVGNHDEREAFRTTFSQLPFIPKDGSIHYAYDLEDVSVLALDTLVDGAHHGALDEEQLNWLDSALSARAVQRCLVMLHHPPFETGIAFMDGTVLREKEKLAAVIEKHPQVERVLCGHLHRAIQAEFAGTLAMTAPSTGHQVKLLLDTPSEAVWAADPPSFYLHRIVQGHPILTHTGFIDLPKKEGFFFTPHLMSS